MTDGHFHRLEVAEVIFDTPFSAIIRLAVPSDLQDAFAFRPGQHLTVRKPDPGADLRRTYSLCNQPLDDGLLIGVKATPGGNVSPWLLTLRPGDGIEVLRPHGSAAFDFAADNALHYVGIAGGSGVTPILSVLSHALSLEPGSRATLLYGARSRDDLMLLEQLLALKDRHVDRFALHCLAEGEEGEATGRRLRNADFAALGRMFGFGAGPADRYLICGPGEMVADVGRALVDLGVPQRHITQEYFTEMNLPESPVSDEAVHSGSLTAIVHGRRWSIDYDGKKGSILDNLLATNAPVPFACRTAVCGACRARLLVGKVHLLRSYALHPEDISRGDVLLCQAFPLTDDVVVEIEA